MIVEVSNEGSLRGSENMRRDLELVERVRNGGVDLPLRFYQWDPWCVSLGTNQQSQNIDAEACASRGIDIVTRPTGGRAVLHACEVTYAFAVRIPAGRTAMDVYRAFHQRLHQALAFLAPELSISTDSPPLYQHYAASGALGQVCFSAHAPSELLWNDRKVVGSAQRVIDGVVLQHGSILCGPGHEELGYVLRAEREMQDRVVAATRASSATLSDVAHAEILPQDVATHLHSTLTTDVLIEMMRAVQ
jgi:lipoate-protein ligase A